MPVLGLVGEFDIASADLLKDALSRAFEDCGFLVIDLSETEFLDSMVLGVLVAAYKNATAAGGWVRLVDPQFNVRRVLELTQLDRLFGLYETSEQAIAHRQ